MTDTSEQRPSQLKQPMTALEPLHVGDVRRFALWNGRPEDNASWWRRLVWRWRRRAVAELVCDQEGLRRKEAGAEHHVLRWERGWLAKLSAWSVSSNYVELGVVLLHKGNTVSERQQTSFRVVLPHDCVVREVPVQQSAAPFMELHDFEALWGLLCGYAQLHGQALEALVCAPTAPLPRWDVTARVVLAPRRALTQSVAVPAGVYRMGSPEQERRRDPDETLRTVRLTRGYLIDVVPVTNGRWVSLMGNHPSRFRGDEHPVESVSWFSAVAYCNALSRQQGLEEAYVLRGVRSSPGREDFWARVTWKGVACEGWRLPTEAEWEIACRAGSVEAMYGKGRAIAWTRKNSGKSTNPVGMKKPNAWGLHDMLGNVWEWVWDCYGAYKTGEVVDPVGPTITGARRTIRGGSWGNHSHLARCANRGFGDPDISDPMIGFRCVRTLPRDALEAGSLPVDSV